MKQGTVSRHRIRRGRRTRFLRRALVFAVERYSSHLTGPMRDAAARVGAKEGGREAAWKGRGEDMRSGVVEGWRVGEVEGGREEWSREVWGGRETKDGRGMRERGGGGRSGQDCGRDGGRGDWRDGGWAGEVWSGGMWWVGEILQWTRPCFEVSQSTSSTVFRFRTDTLLIFSALLMLFWFSFHTFLEPSTSWSVNTDTLRRGRGSSKN